MKLSRKTIIISSASLLIVALLLGGWLIWQSNTQKETPVVTQQNNTPAQPETSLPKPTNEELFAAVNDRKASVVADYVKRGANLNVQDGQGRTPAMVATYNNDYETAKVLIEGGADVNIRDNMLNSPFLYAGAENYLDILKVAAAAHPDTKIVNRFGGTALIPAGEHGHVEVIKFLLENTDIDVDHINNLGWTALLEAILLNNGGPRQQQAVQTLVDHGANVNLADKNGVTPLQHARAKGFTEIVNILQKAGAR